MLVKTEDVPRILTAILPAVFLQQLHNITVTDCGPGKRHFQCSHGVLKGKIGHQGTDHAGHRALACPAAHNGKQQLVAVVNIPCRIDHHHPVAITIERNPEIGLLRQNGVTQRARRRCPDFVIDIQPVRLGADGTDLGTQFVQHVRCNVISRTVRAIDDDLQTTQIHVIWKRALAELDVSPGRIVDSPRASEIGRLHADQRRINPRLDFCLHRIGQLGTVRREKLDAIIVIRVVRCRNDDAGLQTQRACQVSNRWCRHRPDQADINPSCRKPRLQRRFQHVPGNARVFPDQHGWPLAGLQVAAR